MIENNITNAKKILTKLSESNSRKEAKEEGTGWLYTDALILALCGIPGPDIEKLHERMDDTRKEILQIILSDNPWLIERTMGTL